MCVSCWPGRNHALWGSTSHPPCQLGYPCLKANSSDVPMPRLHWFSHCSLIAIRDRGLLFDAQVSVGFSLLHPQIVRCWWYFFCSCDRFSHVSIKLWMRLHFGAGILFCESDRCLMSVVSSFVERGCFPLDRVTRNTVSYFKSVFPDRFLGKCECGTLTGCITTVFVIHFIIFFSLFCAIDPVLFSVSLFDADDLFSSWPFDVIVIGVDLCG